MNKGGADVTNGVAAIWIFVEYLGERQLTSTNLVYVDQANGGRYFTSSTQVPFSWEW